MQRKKKEMRQKNQKRQPTGGRQAHKAGKQLVVLEAEKDGEGFKLSFVRDGYKHIMRRHMGSDQFIGFEKLFGK